MELKELKITYNNNELNYKYLQNDITFNKLIMTFDKNIYNNTFKLNQGEVNITFKNPNNLNEIIVLLDIFFKELSKQKQINQNLIIVFEINNNNKQQEEAIAQNIKNSANSSLQYQVVYKNDINQINNQEQIIDQQQKQELIINGSKQIQKEGINNEIKNYLEINGKIYDDNQSLSINEQKQQLLKAWLNDPLKANEINNLTKEELDARLTQIVTMNLKQHDLTTPTNLTNANNNEFENLSNKVAHEKDGKVNEELGIIENGNYQPNQFTTIEETKDNKLNVVNPTVNQQTISNNYVSNQTISYNNYNYTNDENIEEEEISQREIESTFYIDYNMRTIYDGNNNEIGKLEPNSGYVIDENNNLTKNGQVLGQIDDIRNMDLQHQKNNTRKKVLTKPDGYTSFLMISVLISLVFIIYILITLL